MRLTTKTTVKQLIIIIILNLIAGLIAIMSYVYAIDLLVFIVESNDTVFKYYWLDFMSQLVIAIAIYTVIVRLLKNVTDELDKLVYKYL